MPGKTPNGRSKRVITPSRREQNRIAQRNWRAKQRAAKKHVEANHESSTDSYESVKSSADSSTIVGPSTPTKESQNDMSVAFPMDLAGLDWRWRNLDDPYTTMFSALLYNGSMLNFDLMQLSSCSPATLSPFYDPSISMSDDPALILERVTSSLPSNLPRSLWPTLSQILTPHHPSVDLVPIPALRENALRLSAAMPLQPILWLMKLDIYQNSGLNATKEALKKDGTMAWPWEVEAWKVEPWFRSKWLMATKYI